MLILVNYRVVLSVKKHLTNNCSLPLMCTNRTVKQQLLGVYESHFCGSLAEIQSNASIADCLAPLGTLDKLWVVPLVYKHSYKYSYSNINILTSFAIIKFVRSSAVQRASENQLACVYKNAKSVSYAVTKLHSFAKAEVRSAKGKTASFTGTMKRYSCISQTLAIHQSRTDLKRVVTRTLKAQ